MYEIRNVNMYAIYCCGTDTLIAGGPWENLLLMALPNNAMPYLFQDTGKM